MKWSFFLSPAIKWRITIHHRSQLMSVFGANDSFVRGIDQKLSIRWETIEWNWRKRRLRREMVGTQKRCWDFLMNIFPQTNLHITRRSFFWTLVEVDNRSFLSLSLSVSYCTVVVKCNIWDEWIRLISFVYNFVLVFSNESEEKVN